MTESPTPIHETVREHYAERIKSSASCCGPSDCCSTTDNGLYPVDLLSTVPTDVANTSYGCGDPITLASLKPGETVLDLGSGAGLDCLLAAQKVGEEAVEVVVAALAQSDERLLEEMADLVYHSLVLLETRGLSWNEVVAVLEKRHR